MLGDRMESHRRDFSTAFESGKDGRQAVEGAVRYKKLIFESLGLKKKSILGGNCKKNPVLQK